MKTTNRLFTTMAVLLCLIMGALEVTTVAPAIPLIIVDLHGIHHYGWIVSIYLLASTVMIPIYGKLADIYSKKPVLLLGIGLFLGGAIASGLSRSMFQLIICRFIQGAGAGALQALSFAVVGDIYSSSDRARIQGIFGTAWALSGAVGPFLGGVIVHHFSWRWIFFMNLPIGITAALFLTFFFHEKRVLKESKLDLKGAFLLSGGVICLLLAINGKQMWITLLLAIRLLSLFLVNELYIKEPLLPLYFLANRLMRSSILIGTLVGGIIVSTVSYLPLFIQLVLFYPSTEAGKLLAPLLLGWPLTSALSGILIPKVGCRPLVIGGFFMVALGTIGLPLLIKQGAGIEKHVLYFLLFILGMGLGFGNTALAVAVQNDVPWDKRGIAISSITFSRAIGSAISVGSLGALLTFTLKNQISSQLLEKMLDPIQREKLLPNQLTPLSRVLTDGLGNVFLGIAILAIAALLVSFFFPGPIRQTQQMENKNE